MGAKLEIIVCGAAGRMGRRIVALASRDPDVRLAGAIEAAGHPELGRDAGELAGVGTLGLALVPELAPVAARNRVCLDFTSAEASLEHLRTAAGAGMAMLVGSSGLSSEQRAEAQRLSADTATLVTANVSLGITVLTQLVEQAVAALGPGFDCEIVELHHNRKKDAPSAPALALAAAAAGAAGQDPEASLVLARQGMTGERSAGEIGVVALRGGDSAGEHTVMLAGEGERLELTHRALSRDCLAAGALRAARWLAGRPPGLYSMRDVIGSQP